MMISNRPATLFSPEDAEAQARMLQADDSEWTYEAIHDPQGIGWSFIAIRDEDGDLIGKM